MESNPGFGIFPGIETVSGDSFIIGQFSITGLGPVEIIIAAVPPYEATDLAGFPIPLSQPRGTVLLSTGAEPAPALPPWMLGLLAVLLVGVTVGLTIRQRRAATP